MRRAALLAFVFLAACEKEQPEQIATQPIGQPLYPTPVVIHTPTPPPAAGWVKIQSERWERAQVKPQKLHFIQAIAAQIERSRVRYQNVSGATKVPWTVIASIHNMECGLSFSQNLANGDSLNARTRHVPAGRPPIGNPPFTWEVCAVDALRWDHLDRKPWAQIGDVLQNIEAYNGVGYETYHPKVPSPYLWSWTTIEKPGKYVADGHWSATAISGQCGVVPLLKTLSP